MTPMQKWNRYRLKAFAWRTWQNHRRDTLRRLHEMELEVGVKYGPIFCADFTADTARLA